jgi:hypothetical protein
LCGIIPAAARKIVDVAQYRERDSYTKIWFSNVPEQYLG